VLGAQSYLLRALGELRESEETALQLLRQDRVGWGGYTHVVPSDYVNGHGAELRAVMGARREQSR
jgi:hypothetical protein